MISNYFKIAWRNLMKNKTFSFINVFGLSVGLVCCMLIALYIDHESGYDRHHKNISDLYQLGTTMIGRGETDNHTAGNPPGMAQTMKQEFPEVVETGRLLNLFADSKTLFQFEDENGNKRSFYEDKGYLADASIFRMFTYQFIEGNNVAALSGPNTIVISEEIAVKLFGKTPALNKTIQISSTSNGDNDYRITGVYRPSLSPSHMDAEFFLSFGGGEMEQYINRNIDNFAHNNMFFTYLQLRPGTDYKKLEAKFPSFIKKYMAEDLQKAGRDKKQFLIPVRDIHLFTKVPFNVTPAASRTYLYILSSVALFTLLIACINFMNLSTARSSKRSAEVGVRKVLGAQKNSLVKQFLGESLLMSILAFFIAIAIMFILLPLFNHVSGKAIVISVSHNGWMLGGFFALAIVAGLIAGSYPAFYLSSFVPVKVLKGRFSNSLGALTFRKVLVVFQFVISVVLIIASVVIARQMSYMRNKDLGFTKEQQVIVPLRSERAKSIYAALKKELITGAQVKSIGASFYYPGIFNPMDNVYYAPGQSMKDAKRTRINYVDYDFLPTLGIQPVAGRIFSENFPADTAEGTFRLVINEETVKQIGLGSPEKAVGSRLLFDLQDTTYSFEVIGVVKDFHFEDLHLPITPYAFGVLPPESSSFNYAIVHAGPGNISGLLSSIRGAWNKLNPNEPFEYSLLDADFQKNYEAENKLSAIVGYFTLIAILISCLGLFGLAAFSADQRIKEIGVRKVLGASITGIVGLLSKDFLKLVGLAIIIASPIAWWIMNKWLEDFAYRTNIGPGVFLITASIALLIAAATISFQSVRAALSNPVKSLRTE